MFHVFDVFCSSDMRPFEIVKGEGFRNLCQTLLDIDRKSNVPIESRDIIPNSTTISRRTLILADGERLFQISYKIYRLLFFKERRKLLTKSLETCFKSVKLFAVTGDYWNNKFSSESYVTITLHFGFDNKIEIVVLKAVLFQLSKTGGNNKRQQ